MKALHEDQVRMEAVVEALPQAVVWLNKDLVVEEGKEREAALERARLEARRSSEHTESRGRFLANMSHELRTPLNAILGYTELLIEEEEEVDGEHLEELRRVHRAGGHLLGLINELLDLSKIDAGKMDDDLEPVVVGEVVEHVLETLRPVAAEKGNELLRSGGDAVALADRQRLAQCLLNLIGNACKFTEGGRITVEISVEGPVVQVAVHDTGKGISPSDLQRVFQAFAQADEVSGRGTGLGLPLTRALAQGMGGDLSATSVEGEGSTFTLSLPHKGSSLAHSS